MTGERILVVDDKADIRDIVINYILKPYAFEYMEAKDGQEAFELIQKDPPDLILTDLRMPRMSGIDLLHKMDEEGITIPVVLMTSHGSEDIAIEVFRLGVKNYIRKPFTEEDLLHALEMALTETRLRREQERLNEDLTLLNSNLLLHVEHLEVLYQIGKELLSIDDEEVLFKKALTTAAKTTNSEEVFLVMQQDDKFMLRAHLLNGAVKLLEEQQKDVVLDQAIEKNEARVGEPQVDEEKSDFKLKMYVPFQVGETCGAVIVTQPAASISEPMLHMLSAVAVYISAALERLRLTSLIKK